MSILLGPRASLGTDPKGYPEAPFKAKRPIYPFIMNKETICQEGKEGEKERLKALLDYLEQLLPDASHRQAFRRCLLTSPPTSLRLNPLVAQSQLLRPFLAARGDPVPWCPDAFSLQEAESRLGHTLEFALGAFYLQAKATTLAVEALGPLPGERVLDLCAAPGGKATQIAGRLGNTGLLVANEPQRKRLPSLIGQLERCGVANAVVSKAPGTLLARYFHNYFDRVLVDAPCSGDGLMRKNQRMLRYWSVEDARRQAQLQIGLLRAAFHMLRPGGVLVYSTCSLSLEENEETLLGLWRHYPGQVEIQPIEGFTGLPLPPQLAERFPETFNRCARIWPHLHDTEGAFVARIGKKGKTCWPVQEGDAALWEEEAGTSVEAAAARTQLEAQWGFALPCPADQKLAVSGKYLCLQPQISEACRRQFPFFVRAGMRVGRCHRNHYYLSQQAIVLWGPHLRGPRLELTWDQVRSLFQGQPLSLGKSFPFKGEVLCGFGPWVVCRGLLKTDGQTLQGMVPRVHRRPDLERLI